MPIAILFTQTIKLSSSTIKTAGENYAVKIPTKACRVKQPGGKRERERKRRCALKVQEHGDGALIIVKASYHREITAAPRD
jgi:hypothetical protein